QALRIRSRLVYGVQVNGKHGRTIRAGTIVRVEAALFGLVADPACIRRSPAGRNTGDEKSRTFHLSRLERFPLLNAPFGMVVGIPDGGNTVVQEHRRHVLLQVNMAVDQSGKYGPSIGFDHPRILWI